jgi:mannose/fructose/N-acetylgalactosamine-specific phosphotransferase system component IIC
MTDQHQKEARKIYQQEQVYQVIVYYISALPLFINHEFNKDIIDFIFQEIPEFDFKGI